MLRVDDCHNGPSQLADDAIVPFHILRELNSAGVRAGTKSAKKHILLLWAEKYWKFFSNVWVGS